MAASRAVSRTGVLASRAAVSGAQAAAAKVSGGDAVAGRVRGAGEVSWAMRRGVNPWPPVLLQTQP